MLFEINSKDYTKYIIPSTYNVNSETIYETYEDAKGIKHYVKIREKVSGSFNMEIHNMEEYEAFVADIEASKNALTNTHNIYLMVNNKAAGSNYHCIIKMESKRSLDGTRQEYIEQFTVNVEER